MKFLEGFFIIYGADGGIYCRIDYAGVDRAQGILDALNAKRSCEIRLIDIKKAAKEIEVASGHIKDGVIYGHIPMYEAEKYAMCCAAAWGLTPGKPPMLELVCLHCGQDPTQKHPLTKFFEETEAMQSDNISKVQELQ